MAALFLLNSNIITFFSIKILKLFFVSKNKYKVL